MKLTRLSFLLISGLLFSLSDSLYANSGDPCGFMGQLFYIGKTSDNSRSFWLSHASNQTTGWTDATFEGPAGQIFDTFSISTNQFHFSSSPIVASGTAGEHSVFDNTQGSCLIDSTQQVGGVIIPVPGGGGGGGGGGKDTVQHVINNVNESVSTIHMVRAWSITERIVYGLETIQSDYHDHSKWQIWAEPRYSTTRDKRDDLNGNDHSGNLFMGGHYRLNDTTLLGLGMALDRTTTNVYGGTLENKMTGYMVGPYAGYKPNHSLFLDSWVAYAHNNTNTHLDVLSGNFSGNSFIYSGNITGTFPVNTFNVLPKISLFLSQNSAGPFNYQGVLDDGTSLTLNMNSDYFAYGNTQFSTEILKPFTTPNGVTLIPSAKLGVIYNIIRPNGGKVLNQQLAYANTSPWGGYGVLGLGIEPIKKVRADLQGSYYTGNSGLGIWEARLALTVSA